MTRTLNIWFGALCASLLVCAIPLSAAAQVANACNAASLVNPDAPPVGAGGIGGTGIDAGAGGMGGTGVNASAGGMGGTGINAGAGGMGGTGTVADIVPIVPGSGSAGGMGGTGIVGVITGFASICVNGMEVHYDNRTPVAVNGQPGAARNLAVGQLVAVNAREVGGRLQADGIGVVDAVAGPITRVNAVARTIQVMGQTVRTDSAAGAALSSLSVGAIARVSGHRTANGDVIATRVDSAAAGAASVHGTVTRVEADAIVVNGTRVTLGGRGTRGITAGSEVFASGEWNGTALRAQRVDAQPVRNAIARAERAVIEGYVRNKSTREINVGGVSVRIDERVRYNRGNERDAVVGAKVQVEVRRSGNDWRAERVILQRDERGGRGGRDDTTQRSGDSGRDSGESSGRSGSDRSDSDRSGSDRSGSDRSGSDRSGSDRSGSDRSGRDSGSGSGRRR